MTKFWLSILCFILLSPVAAQNLEELKKKREKNQKDLIYIQNLLKNTSKDKKKELNRLHLINDKIKIRQNLISDISKEVDYLDDISEIELELINDLELDLKKIKNVYSRTIKYNYLLRNQQDVMMFLLSSNNFNQAYKRLRHLKQIRDFSKNKVKEIKQISEQINNRLSEIKNIRTTKIDLLGQQQKENNTLKKEKQEQSKYLNQLSKKEKKLKSDLKKQEKLAAQLDEKIRKLIAKDVKKSKGTEGEMKLTPQQKKLSGNFENNKGKLPWPTTTGYISSSFGEQAHPVLKRVKIRNDGVDITTDKEANCKAIFDGEISEISTLPGLNNIIMIRHGNFLTVYVNLINIKVTKGDKIKKGQNLGTVFTNKDTDKTVLKFQIWKGFDKLNPTLWLSK